MKFSFGKLVGKKIRKPNNAANENKRSNKSILGKDVVNDLQYIHYFLILLKTGINRKESSTAIPPERRAINPPSTAPKTFCLEAIATTIGI